MVHFQWWVIPISNHFAENIGIWLVLLLGAVIFKLHSHQVLSNTKYDRKKIKDLRDSWVLNSSAPNPTINYPNEAFGEILNWLCYSVSLHFNQKWNDIWQLRIKLIISLLPRKALGFQGITASVIRSSHSLSLCGHFTCEIF